MLQSTFQIAPGIGPAKEHSLWARGIACWDDLPAAPSVALSKQRDPALRAAVDDARAALSRGDADALAAMLPVRRALADVRRFRRRRRLPGHRDRRRGRRFRRHLGDRLVRSPRATHLSRRPRSRRVPVGRARLLDAGHLQWTIVRRADPVPRVSRVDAAARSRRSAPRPGARGPRRRIEVDRARARASCVLPAPRTWPASAAGTQAGYGGAAAGATAIATRSACSSNTTCTT